LRSSQRSPCKAGLLHLLHSRCQHVRPSTRLKDRQIDHKPQAISMHERPALRKASNSTLLRLAVDRAIPRSPPEFRCALARRFVRRAGSPLRGIFGIVLLGRITNPSREVERPFVVRCRRPRFDVDDAGVTRDASTHRNCFGPRPADPKSASTRGRWWSPGSIFDCHRLCEAVLIACSISRGLLDPEIDCHS